MRPQLIPEHEKECLSPAQTKMLYEYLEDEKVIDPVKLDLCDYQAIEPVHLFCLLREDMDSLTEVSPCCHDLKEDLMSTKFFIIFVKYVVYDWG